MALPPPPIYDQMGSWTWLRWFDAVNFEIDNAQNVTWGNIDFTGSNLTDIATKNHDDLGSKDGGGSGEFYHMTAAEHTSATAAGPLKVKSYTVAGLPTASSYTNHIIYVSDETGGATLAFSDGSNWLRVQDRAVVS